jgi:hypothetical protein
MLGELDPQRWQWWSRAASLGDYWRVFARFAEQVELFNSGSGSTASMFAIGQALHGHVNDNARTIFSSDYRFDSLIGPAKQSIAFYEAQLKGTKEAMHT